MLHAICRCIRPRLHQLIPLFLLIGCCLPLCYGSGRDRSKQGRLEQERLVSVKLTDEARTQKVLCGSFQRLELFTTLRSAEAEEAGKDRYEFPAFEGELLMVKLSKKVDMPTDEISFPYIFRGDEKTPLVFSRQPGRMLLNGKVIYVDLFDKAGAQWFAQQPDAKLKTILTLILSGDPATDTAVLTRMAGSGITIALLHEKNENNPSESNPTVKAKMRRALIAVKPTCLITPKIDQDMIAQLTDLTHLMIPGNPMPDLTKLKKTPIPRLFWRGYNPGSPGQINTPARS